MKNFNVPVSYRSELISRLKLARQKLDPKRKDTSPTRIDLGPVVFLLARHFGFCYGVENAIDIAYRALDENPDKKIFLLSEMIHNPEVNQDILNRGANFLMSPHGETLIPISELNSDDIVIVPAFGTTIELQDQLAKQGINPRFYDTTCPFVEKVWKRSRELAGRGFSVVIHGKPRHEETRATFSQTLGSQDLNSPPGPQLTVPRVIVRDKSEAQLILNFIQGNLTKTDFLELFQSQISVGFDPELHLEKLGVVNQTTMLASETHEISSMLRDALVQKYGEENIAKHFGDTRDTLCYATYENQTATMDLLKEKANIALVIGGYNSSNTSHLVELCEEKLPTYFLRNESEIVSANLIRHFNLQQSEVLEKENWLPGIRPLTISVTSGASCPDAVVEGVMKKVAGYCNASFDTWLR